MADDRKTIGIWTSGSTQTATAWGRSAEAAALTEQLGFSELWISGGAGGELAPEFGAALDVADEVVVLDVFGAREKPLPGVNGALVAQSVSKPVHYQPDMSRVGRQAAGLARPGDVVITMGAGDVTMLGGQILDGLRVRPPTGR